MKRRTKLVALGTAGALTAAGGAYAAAKGVQARRHRADRATGDLELPDDVRHHHLPLRDGGRLHVVERGTGPPLVLLHGAGLAAAVWAYQLRDLAEEHRVIAVDLRGHGDSTAGSEGITITAMAADVAEALAALDCRQALVAGHSMGGMVTLRLLRRHADVAGERVGAVAFVASSGGLGPAVPAWEQLARSFARAAGSGAGRVRAGRPTVPAGELGYLASRIGFGQRPRPAEVAATLAMLRGTAPGVFVGLWPEVLAFDEHARFEDLSLPVVVAVGTADHLTPPLYARRLAASLPHAELREFVGAGHMLMYERREELGELLEVLAVKAAAGSSRRRSDGSASR